MMDMESVTINVGKGSSIYLNEDDLYDERVKKCLNQAT
jgi:hypothetical protein